VSEEKSEAQKHKLEDPAEEDQSPVKKLKTVAAAGDTEKPAAEAEPVTNGHKPDTDEPAKAEPVKDDKMNGDTDNVKLQKQITRQIEYYFGDVNLPKDRFLQEKIKEDEEGWVSLEVLLTFNRLASISTDQTLILNTLQSSALIEVDMSGKKVRRSPGCPLPEWNEQRKEDLMRRTVYVKGLSIETPPTLDDLLQHFKQYGVIENIQMRTLYDKLEKKASFKGSAFILFKVLDEATKFIELESVKYDDKELIKKWQKDWIEEKKEEIQEKKIDKRKKKEEKQSSFKNRRDAEKEQKDGSDDEEAEVEKVDQFSLKGVVLQMTELSDTTTREDIKEALETHDANVAYVDFQKGDTAAKIRFREAGEANKIHGLITADDGKLTICECEVSTSVM